MLENYNRKHSTILLELSKELRESRIQHLFHFYSENTKSLEDRTEDRTPVTTVVTNFKSVCIMGCNCDKEGKVSSSFFSNKNPNLL